jgi:hypothetical protein
MRICISIVIFFFLCPVWAFASGWQTFWGTIGGDLPVWMRLEDEQDSVKGKYFFEKDGEERPLIGKRNDTKYDLFEIGSAGKTRSVFHLSDDHDKKQLRGSWKAVKGKGQLPVVLSYSSLPELTRSGEPLRKTTNRITYSNKERQFSIEVEYPELKDVAQDYGRAFFNTRIAAFARAKADSAKKNYDVPFPRDLWITAEMISEMKLRYDVVYSSDKLASVVFKEYNYSIGSAHGYEATITKNFSFARSHELEFRDLFRKGMDYLKPVSEYCKQDLEKQMRERARYEFEGKKDSSGLSGRIAVISETYRDWIADGASAKPENYRSFSLSPEGIRIYFDPYRVAAYVDGPFEVLIPPSALREILSEDSDILSILH